MAYWQTVKLGEALELAYGKSLPKGNRVGGTVPVFGSNGVTGWHDTALINETTVIVGRKGSAGAVQYVEGPCYPIDTTYYVRTRQGFHFEMKFLYYLLRKLDLSRLKTATGVPGLTREDAYKEKIPVPPLLEQRRIVDILSRAEGIIRLQRQAADKAREIIPALFLDMFGDPATNPKGWPIRRLGDLAEKMSDGPFGSNLKTAHYTETGVRVVRLQNISVGSLNDEDKAFVSHEHFASLPRHRCLPGDVIIGTLGDPNLRAIVLPPSIPEALNKADCVQFRCRLDTVLPEYICWLMNVPSTLAMAASLVQGITRTRISMGRLREMFVPVPSLRLQKKFADRTNGIRGILSQRETSQRSGVALFNALLANVLGN
jgi:type I restriction enzyme S subunit